MNGRLTYRPAYVGLFASLILALACNAFLDIQYGAFGFEMSFWILFQGWTLRVGWRQQGEANDAGKQKQKIVLLISLVLAVLVFIPMWGFPRAGLYLLAALQAAQNCVTTARRQLHLGLLVSAVMVIFAAAHFRADWTMLFYLVPYIVAVVFTLVAEQISRRAQSIRDVSLRDIGRAGQGMAIAVATAIILLFAGLFYALTPQLGWPYLESRYGQPSNLGFLNESKADNGGAGGAGEGQAGEGKGKGRHGKSASGDSANPGQEQNDLSPWKGWPTPGQMREAAGRQGMPAWQTGAILQMADLSEAIAETLAPLMDALNDFLEQLKQWLKENRRAVLATLFALITMMLLLCFAILLREAKVRTWLRTRFDYCYLVMFAKHAMGRAGAIQFYRAMERLFILRDQPRPVTATAWEFLQQATYFREGARPAASELTGLFEQCRYGLPEPADAEIQRMRDLYRTLFGEIG